MRDKSNTTDDFKEDKVEKRLKKLEEDISEDFHMTLSYDDKGERNNEENDKENYYNEGVHNRNTSYRYDEEDNYSQEQEDNKLIKQKKKRKRIIVASVICLVLVLVGAVATKYIAKIEEKKKFEREKKAAQEAAITDSSKALEKYFQCLTAGDYAKLYNAVDKETKTKRAADNFEFVNKAFYGNINMQKASIKIKSCKILGEEGAEKKDGSDKTSSSDNKKSASNDSEKSTIDDKYNASNTVIEYTVTVKTDGGEFSFDNTTNMIKEDDSWRVVWEASTVYPEYEALDVVKTSYASTLRGDILDRDGNILATMQDGVRSYPVKNAAAHMVGFVSKITNEEIQERIKNNEFGYSNTSIVGKKGLEYAFESTLRGQGGQKIELCDKDGNLKKVVSESEAVKGQDLKTTVSTKMQQVLHDTLGQDKGCSVAMNPYTGEILAMVSTPSYDNNGIAKGSASDTYNLFARSYCPGSTFKSITGAIGLNTGAFTKDTDFGRSPMRWQKDSSWGNLFITTTHSSNGTFNNAITVSDNVYFAKAALKIGTKKMKEELDKIGFNEQLPIEMNFNKSQYSNGETFSSEGMLANSGYGQGEILVNPLHMATIYAAFLNGGNMVNPVFTYDGTPKNWKENAFKKEVCDTVLEGLRNVVKSGTATSLNSAKVAVAGKTGTAEIKASQDDTSGTELGWFVALTPDVEQKDAIVLVTMIQDVKNRGGSGYVVTKTKEMINKIY